MIYLACTLACVCLALHIRWAYIRDQWSRRQIRMLKESVARLQVADQNHDALRSFEIAHHALTDAQVQEALRCAIGTDGEKLRDRPL